MAEARALGAFQERVKSVLGSLLEVLLLEITEAYRQSLCTSHCECFMLNTDTTTSQTWPDPVLNMITLIHACKLSVKRANDK